MLRTNALDYFVPPRVTKNDSFITMTSEEVEHPPSQHSSLEEMTPQKNFLLLSRSLRHPGVNAINLFFSSSLMLKCLSREVLLKWKAQYG